jgi:hypothetical protein
MTPHELLSDLADQGIVFKVHEGSLKFHPKLSVTPDLLALIRQHKAALIKLLTGLPRWYEFHHAIIHAFANPSSREKIGPLWMTEPDGFGPCEFHETTIPGDCDHFGCDQYKDYSIQWGRSIRRDCANCGRFIQWQKWNPPPQEDRSR